MSHIISKLGDSFYIGNRHRVAAILTVKAFPHNSLEGRSLVRQGHMPQGLFEGSGNGFYVRSKWAGIDCVEGDGAGILRSVFTHATSQSLWFERRERTAELEDRLRIAGLLSRNTSAPDPEDLGMVVKRLAEISVIPPIEITFDDADIESAVNTIQTRVPFQALQEHLVAMTKALPQESKVLAGVRIASAPNFDVTNIRAIGDVVSVADLPASQLS